MAATRSKNTPGNYQLYKRELQESRDYEIYQPKAIPRAPAMPAMGITPSFMSRDTLSNNAVDIETMLFGINANNLETPQAPIQPALKQIPTIHFFERLPVIMPGPLVIENKQRPYPI